MPLPLLVPAAVAASSEFSLLTLITSTTIALTGGVALGSQLSTSSSNEKTYDEQSFSSLITELKTFPLQTKVILTDIFRDFREDSKQVVESTEKLSTLSVQLTEAIQITQNNTKCLQEKIQEPFVRVGNALNATHIKTDEVTSQLKKAQESLEQANKQIDVLSATLKEQQETVTRLNAQVVPLTKALTVQTKEKEQAQKKIEQMKKQQEGMRNGLTTQVELNKRLSERLSSLELELERVDTLYQKSLIQKQTIEALLSDYKKQQDSLLQRINELEKESEHFASHNKEDCLKSQGADELQINALTMEREQLQESLKHQNLINKKLEETLQLLEQQAISLEASLIQLKKDYDISQNNYQNVCLLVTSLNSEAQEQEALIVEQEEMIAKLTSGRSYTAMSSLGFFSKETALAGGTAASKEHSFNPH